MKSWMTALGALMLVSAACTPLLINGGGGGEGGGGAQGNTGTGGQSANTRGALVMRLADAPPGVLPTGSATSQAPTDPDTLVLFFFSNEAISCTAPLPEPTAPCIDKTSWELVLFIPPSLQGSGPIDLASPEVYFHAEEQLPTVAGTESCAGGEGEGNGTPGTLVIDSSNPSAFTLTLSGGVAAMEETIDGTYAATMCP